MHTTGATRRCGTCHVAHTYRGIAGYGCPHCDWGEPNPFKPLHRTNAILTEQCLWTAYEEKPGWLFALHINDTDELVAVNRDGRKRVFKHFDVLDDPGLRAVWIDLQRAHGDADAAPCGECGRIDSQQCPCWTPPQVVTPSKGPWMPIYR